jgi:hypothetical protein
MNKVVSVFRALLEKPKSISDLPLFLPTPPAPKYESSWQNILVPDLHGYKIKSSIGKITLQRSPEPSFAPIGSVYSPRTQLCGPNYNAVPVTTGKPYRVLATYVGLGRRKKQIHFFQFQCDDGSIHLIKSSECEFLAKPIFEPA